MKTEKFLKRYNPKRLKSQTKPSSSVLSARRPQEMDKGEPILHNSANYESGEMTAHLPTAVRYKSGTYNLEKEKIKRILKNADNPNTCECLYHEGWRAGKAETIKEVRKIATYLNTKFRKNNTYVRVSADEFNDIWEEELIKEIQKLGELAK